MGVRRSIVALALASVVGCTHIGPDYEQPEVDWLASWESALYGQRGAASSPDDLSFWWRLFDDPELNALIASARRENPGLRIAGLRILESRAVLGIAGSALYPQLQQVSAGAAYSDTRQSGSNPLVEGERGSFQAGANLAWELDFWGRFARGIESADAAFFASIANQQQAQLLLASTVADVYFAYRTVERRLTVVRENARLQARSVDITRSLFESGQQSELDLRQAETQYLGTLAGIPALEQTRVQLRNALCALLGRPPGDLPMLTARDELLPSIDPLSVNGAPAVLMQRRPDVRAALWGVAAQSARIGIAETDFYPAVALLGSFRWSGTTQPGAAENAVFAAGPALQWNVFDYGRIRNNVRVEDARLQQLIEAYRDTLIGAAREIDDAAIAVVKTREQGGYFDDAVASSRRALDLAQSRYREGYADFQRVLDAQRAVVTQTERAVITRGQHLAAVVALYKALGGGWTDVAIDELIPESVRRQMVERSNWGELMDAPLPSGRRVPTESDRES